MDRDVYDTHRRVSDSSESVAAGLGALVLTYKSSGGR